MVQIIKTWTGRLSSRYKLNTSTSVAGTKRRSSFYLLITTGICVTAFWGFTYTYFGTSSVYYTNENGEPVELEDTFLVILKKDKTDGKWRIHREVASAVVE